MTPVLDGRTLSTPPGRLRAFATDSHTRLAFAMPSPPEQTLDTLLLITRVWIGFPDASLERPTRIGDPGNYSRIRK